MPFVSVHIPSGLWSSAKCYEDKQKAISTCTDWALGNWAGIDGTIDVYVGYVFLISGSGCKLDFCVAHAGITPPTRYRLIVEGAEGAEDEQYPETGTITTLSKSMSTVCMRGSFTSIEVRYVPHCVDSCDY